MSIEIANIKKSFGRTQVLNDISLDIPSGQMVALLGPSGSGKTTLLNLIAGFLTPASGTLMLEGRVHTHTPPSQRPVSMLFQENNLFNHLTVWQNIALGMDPGLKLSVAQRQTLEAIAEQMGLAAFINRLPGELSGGQLQRVLLGRSIVSRPQVLILDEPNSYVDKRFESRFYQLLEEINKESAIILVSHDIGTVLTMVKNIACVNETLHYHPGANVSEEWLGEKYACPIELVGHGDLPHRVLRKHQHE